MMDEETAVLVAVIVILLLVIIYTGCDGSFDLFKEKIEHFVNPPKDKKEKERVLADEEDSSEDPTDEEVQLTKDAKFDDSDEKKGECGRNIFESVTPKKNTMYGTKTNSRRVNFGLGVGNHSRSDDYNFIVLNEIGDRTIDSHKGYCKSIVNDSNLRYLDTELETDYVKAEGISLSRRSNPAIASLNATQQVGLMPSDYKETGSITDFSMIGR